MILKGIEKCQADELLHREYKDTERCGKYQAVEGCHAERSQLRIRGDNDGVLVLARLCSVKSGGVRLH